MRMTDFGSLRLGAVTRRSFLPYGFVGVAMGQADINRRATLICSTCMSAHRDCPISTKLLPSGLP